MGENPCQLVIQWTIEDQSIQGDKNETRKTTTKKKPKKSAYLNMGYGAKQKTVRRNVK